MTEEKPDANAMAMRRAVKDSDVDLSMYLGKVTSRQASDYISSVSPASQRPASQTPNPKPAGKRRSLFGLAVGIVQRDVGDMTWGRIVGTPDVPVTGRKAP